MPNYTSNYSFIKPKKGENYDVDQTTNINMDLIDTELFKKVNKIPGKDLSTNDFTDNYKFKIDTMSNIYSYKGAIETIEELPAQGNKIGDVYSVENENASFAWDGTEWNPIGNIINLEEFFDLINDIEDKIGNLTNLTTTQKDNIVTAINELVTKLGTKVNSSTYNNKMASLDTQINSKQNANYYEASVNGADFTINCSVSPSTGTEYKIHFAATNNTNDARLSVDNGTTFYNVDGCKAIALGGEYLRVVFDGTKFLYMTDLGPSTIEYVQEVQQ